MYKDPDKQREANRQASQRRRDKGMTQGVMLGGFVIPEHPVPVIPEQANIPADKREQAVKSERTLVSLGCEEDRIRRAARPKRGKDIKCFNDLPVDVQQTIDRMSAVDGKLDQTVKANRTAIAIHYQHLFPDRYYSTGVAI